MRFSVATNKMKQFPTLNLASKYLAIEGVFEIYTAFRFPIWHLNQLIH